MTAPQVAALVDLDPVIAYRLLQLRVDVFVVEQECAYRELDGRDLEPGARQCWIGEGDEVIACLRLLAEPGATTRLGRVAVADGRRGEGLAGRLVGFALGLVNPPVVADVQSRLAGWYEQFGFVVDGEEFVEDGIAHIPMRLR